MLPSSVTLDPPSQAGLMMTTAAAKAPAKKRGRPRKKAS